MRGTAKPSEEWVLTWDEFLAQADGTPEKAVDDAVQKLDPDGIATLIYTSGTTGPPKGVMLSHENIAWTSKIAEGLVSLRSDDCSLSYLAAFAYCGADVFDSWTDYRGLRSLLCGIDRQST